MIGSEPNMRKLPHRVLKTVAHQARDCEGLAVTEFQGGVRAAGSGGRGSSGR